MRECLFPFCTDENGKSCCDKRCDGVYTTFLIVVGLIIMYKLVLKSCTSPIENCDPLNSKIIDIPIENCCSWWPVTHFLLFAYMGYKYPHCQTLVIIAGVVWEIFESFMFAISGERATSPSSVEYGSWWAGSIKDVAFDVAGYYFGRWIALRHRKDDKS